MVNDLIFKQEASERIPCELRKSARKVSSLDLLGGCAPSAYYISSWS
jgi:hypothetical protein